MANIRSIPVRSIQSSGSRKLDVRVVDELALSLRTNGLLQPIIVCDGVVFDGIAHSGFRVVCGDHRLAAAKQLKWDVIDAIVVDADALHAELMTIDENLCRAELGKNAKAKATARRKQIYEALHPETKHGGDRKYAPNVKSSRQVGDSPPAPSFTEATAAATGQSERDVQRYAELGEKVCDEASALIDGTELDTITFMETLKAMTPQEQVAHVHLRLDAIADKEKRDVLAVEAAERRKVAREDARAAVDEFCSFLFEKLNAKQWRYVIDVTQRAGWTATAKSMRAWEAPQARNAA